MVDQGSTPSTNPKPARAHRKYDEVFGHIRSFGTYQRVLYFWINLTILPIMAQFSAQVFAFGTPQFHCVTANVTCPPKKCCDNCTTYVFDGPMKTTTSEFFLICERAHIGASLQSCYYAGMLVGSLINGIVSDALGRKTCIFINAAIMITSSIASTLVGDCVSFIGFLRFLVGFGAAGQMLAVYVYNMEMIGPKRRTLIGSSSNLFFNSFALLIVMVAYFIRDWRIFVLVTTLPNLLLIPSWKFVPESPRWLVAHGRLDEAHAVLMKCGPKKGKQLDPELVRALLEDVRGEQLEREKEKSRRKYTPLDLLRTPKLRKWTLIMFYEWFTVALANFGLYLFISQLAGNIYLNYSALRIAIMLRFPIVWFLLLKLGRRILLGSTMLVGGVTCLVILALYEGYPLVGTGLAALGFIFINTNWTTVYLITAEITPTVLRNTAIGSGSTSARLGALLAPYIAMMGQLPGLSLVFPVIIFGTAPIVAMVMSYWLPETLFVEMHQTIEEAENGNYYYGIPCCRRPPAEPDNKAKEVKEVKHETEEPLLEEKGLVTLDS